MTAVPIVRWGGWSPRPERERTARRVRYAAREVLWSHSTLPRVRKCGRVVTSDQGVAVVVGDGVAHYRNVARCASVHACPVCSAKIRQTRAEEIDQAHRYHLRTGGHALLITLTLPHDAGDRLDALLAAILAGRARAFSGCRWKRERETFGIVGAIWALEVTHGPSGWHPHVHVLVFTRSRLTRDELRVLKNGLYSRWTTAIEGHGFRRPTRRRGLDVRHVNRLGESLGTYLTDAEPDTAARVGMELARADLKAARAAGYRNVGEVLRDVIRYGDGADLALWGEYERATKGKRAVVWSRGLKAQLLVVERSDEDIVEAEELGEVVAVLTSRVWSNVTRYRGLAAAVLDGAELGGLPGVHAVLDAVGARAGP